MKITQYGTVILTTGPVRIEGWRVQREPEDPPEAKTEQLLLEFAINWAKDRLTAAVSNAMLDVARAKIAKERADEQK